MQKSDVFLSQKILPKSVFSEYHSEKKQLQNLNLRLSNYIKHNAKGLNELIDIEFITKELADTNENIRDIYGEEMTQLRECLNEISKKYAEASIQLKVVESEKENACSRLIIFEKLNTKLNNQIEELFCEIASLNKKLSNLNLIENDLKDSKKQLDSLHTQLEEETIYRTGLENSLISLLEEMELQSNVHSEVTAKWRHDLLSVQNLALSNIAQKGSTLIEIDKYFEELKAKFFSKFQNNQDIESQRSNSEKFLNPLINRINDQNAEILKLRNANSELNSKLDKQERDVREINKLNEKISQLVEELDSERDRNRKEVSRLADLLDAKTDECRNLACSKILLDSELAYYRCLLSDENKRLYFQGKSCNDLTEHSFSFLSEDEGVNVDIDYRENIFVNKKSLNDHSHGIETQEPLDEQKISFETDTYASISDMLKDKEAFFPNLEDLIQNSLKVWPQVQEDLPITNKKRKRGYFQNHPLIVSSLIDSGINLQPDFTHENASSIIKDSIVCNLCILNSHLSGILHLENYSLWIGPDYSCVKTNPFTQLYKFNKDNCLVPDEFLHISLICEAFRLAIPLSNSQNVYIKLTRRVERFLTEQSHIFILTNKDNDPVCIWSARPGCSHLKSLADRAIVNNKNSILSTSHSNESPFNRTSSNYSRNVRFNQNFDEAPSLIKRPKRTWNTSNSSPRFQSQNNTCSLM